MYGQRRYGGEVLGRLAFIGVAQSAGFKLGEIKELVASTDAGEDMGGRMRSLSERRLGEVQALLERTQAMKGWLEVAQQCGCESPEECTLFDQPAGALPLVRVDGGSCRRTGR